MLHRLSTVALALMLGLASASAALLNTQTLHVDTRAALEAINTANIVDADPAFVEDTGQWYQWDTADRSGDITAQGTQSGEEFVAPDSDPDGSSGAWVQLKDTAARTTFSPSGNLAATNVQSAIEELDTESYRAGGTDVPIADGGTGASTSKAARENLGDGTRHVTEYLTNLSSAVDQSAELRAAIVALFADTEHKILDLDGRNIGISSKVEVVCGIDGFTQTPWGNPDAIIQNGAITWIGADSPGEYMMEFGCIDSANPAAAGVGGGAHGTALVNLTFKDLSFQPNAKIGCMEFYNFYIYRFQNTDFNSFGNNTCLFSRSYDDDGYYTDDNGLTLTDVRFSCLASSAEYYGSPIKAYAGDVHIRGGYSEWCGPWDFHLGPVEVDGVHFSMGAFGSTTGLRYDGETSNFTVGATLLAPVSGATGTITSIHDDGTAGEIRLTSVSGTFVNNEAIEDDSGGAALANDTQYTRNYMRRAAIFHDPRHLTIHNNTLNNTGMWIGNTGWLANEESMNNPPSQVAKTAWHGINITGNVSSSNDFPASVLRYDAQSAEFTVGSTVTGGTSGNIATIVYIQENDDTGADATYDDGKLWIMGATGTFTDNEAITDSAGGSATANGVVAARKDTYVLETFLANSYILDMEISGNSSSILTEGDNVQNEMRPYVIESGSWNNINYNHFFGNNFGMTAGPQSTAPTSNGEGVAIVQGRIRQQQLSTETDTTEVHSNYYGLTKNFMRYANSDTSIGSEPPTLRFNVYENIDGEIVRFQDSDGACHHNPESASEIIACSSDRRLKVGITDAPNLSDRWLNIPIHEYAHYATPTDRIIGTIAQEVQAFMPDLVAPLAMDNDRRAALPSRFDFAMGDYLGVRNPTPWELLKIIQEQRATIVGLTDRLVALESANDNRVFVRAAVER